jgi:hypothetical protein
MEQSQYNREQYERARKQVHEIKGFYSHLTVYVLVIGFLVFINLRYSPEYLWFFWPALGWGIGLVSHSIKAFNWIPYFGKDWEERKIKEFMNNENQKNNL